MRGKFLSVFFRYPSDSSDISCNDGELIETVNVEGFPDNAFPEESQGETSGDDSVEIPGNDSGDDFSGGGNKGAYIHQLPKPPMVEFALVRKPLPGWHNHILNPPSTVIPAKIQTEEGWGERAMEVLSRFVSDAGKRGMFTAPFFALFALRVEDGSRILPGPPVLMIPNSSAPVVGGNDEWESESMKMTVAGATCGLQIRISDTSIVKEFEGGITHLDIFVSDPLLSFDVKGRPVCRHRHSPAVFSHSKDTDGNFSEHLVYDDTFPVSWEGAVSSLSFRKPVFRHVSAIPVGTLSDREDFEDLSFNCCEVANLEVADSYAPDYAHLHGISASFSRSISGKLTLCGLTLTSPAPFTPASFASHVAGVSSSGKERVAVEVEILKEGELIRSSVCTEIADSEFLGEMPPRWIFYPDPDAVKLTVVSESGSWSVPLRRHPSLYGSYYSGGLGEGGENGFKLGGSTLSETTPASIVRPSYSLPSGIWRSEGRSRLLFPDRLLSQLEIGRAIALCRAFRASGLVATTAPTLYLFTDEGVFLLKEMEDGSLRDAGLMGAYVLRDPDSFMVRDGYVEFTDAQGRHLIIDGTKIKPFTSRSDVSEKIKAGGAVCLRSIDSSEEISFTTRVLKFGDLTSRKRLASVELLGIGDTSRFSIVVKGSDNLRDWNEVARGEAGCVKGLWRRGYRFYRVSLSGLLDSASCLEGLLFRFRELL